MDGALTYAIPGPHCCIEKSKHYHRYVDDINVEGGNADTEDDASSSQNGSAMKSWISCS